MVWYGAGMDDVAPTIPDPTPTQFLDLIDRLGLRSQELAVDTETSGLHPDDGARVSTVSVALSVPDHAHRRVMEAFGTGPLLWPGGQVQYDLEDIGGGADPVWVLSAAWPFDQGVAGTGKPEDTGQAELIPATLNQPEPQFRALLEGLGRFDLVFHHASFDLAMLRAGCRRWPGVGVDLLDRLWWDTQNGCQVLYAHLVQVRGAGGAMVPTTSLKPTAAWLWGDGVRDEQSLVRDYLRSARLPAGRWDLMPWDRIGQYASLDARLTLRLYLRQLWDVGRASEAGVPGGVPAPVRGDLMDLLLRRMEVTRMLVRTERRGVPFSAQEAERARVELAAQMQRVAQSLPFAPNIGAAKRYWFGPRSEGGLGLAPYATTAGGAVSLTEQVLRRMVDDGVPGAGEYARYKGWGSAVSRWYSGWAQMVGADGRLHPKFRQNGTVSGRFSVERVQLQAIPHDYRLGLPDGVPTPRGLIEAGVPEGWRLVECDLANAEARVAALLAGCGSMLSAFREGRDLHGETARVLFRVKTGDPRWSQWRTLAKRANFSFIFGVGADTFRESLAAEGTEISPAQAQQIVRDWNALYPEYRAAIERHEVRVRARQSSHGVGWVDLLNGERRFFPAGEDPHKAFNQRVQGNLAQFAQSWWLDAQAAVDGLLAGRVSGGLDVESGVWVGGVGGVLMVHDSLDLLVPVGEFGDEVVDAVVRSGGRLWSEWFPGVPGRVDPTPW